MPRVHISDYIFTPRDVMRAIPHASAKSALKILVLAALFAVLKILGYAGVELLFFIAWFLGHLFWRASGRSSFILALTCLIVIPLLLIAAQNFWLPIGNVWTETVAVWAYYFLAIGTILEITSQIISPKAPSSRPPPLTRSHIQPSPINDIHPRQRSSLRP